MLKRADLDVSEQAVKDLREQGVQVITTAFDPQAPYVPVVAARVTWSERRRLWSQFFSARWAVQYMRAWWIVAWLIVIGEKVLFWRKLLQALNVKVYVSRSTYLFEGLDMALAELGGCSVAYQFSNQTLPNPTVGTCFDVFCGFATYYREVFARAYSHHAYFIVSGYPYDEISDGLRTRARAVRRQLQAAGAEFILCVFDENWSSSPYGAVTRDDHIRFLRTFLDWLLEDVTLGVVLKQQFLDNTPIHFPELEAITQAALATGRLHIYGEGQRIIRTRPSEAALTADLTVNHIYGATAGLESALAGTRTVLIDLVGYPYSPIVCWGGADVVVKSYADLKRSVAGWRSGDPAYGRLGDWSAFLDRLVSLPDGKAADRMGELLRNLVSALEQGHSREWALISATAHYAQQWGSDYVWACAPDGVGS